MCVPLRPPIQHFYRKPPFSRIPNLLEESLDPRVPSRCPMHQRNHPRDRLSPGRGIRRDGHEGLLLLRFEPTPTHRHRVPFASGRLGVEMVLNRIRWPTSDSK